MFPEVLVLFFFPFAAFLCGSIAIGTGRLFTSKGNPCPENRVRSSGWIMIGGGALCLILWGLALVIESAILFIIGGNVPMLSIMVAQAGACNRRFKKKT